MPEASVSVVIPAYNESLRISETLARVQQFLDTRNSTWELIIVDDGSSDDMPNLLAKYSAQHPATRVLRNEPNRGKGYSIRRGSLEAHGEFILFTDADLSAPIEEAEKLLSAMETAKADAAVGSRALDRRLIGVRQPWRREMAGRVFNLLVRLFTGLKIRDTQCGFKLFRRETTRRAFELLTVEGFGFDPELLFLIEHLGGQVVEVPVRWNDNPATKVHFLRDSTRMFLDLVRLRWRAVRGKYPRQGSSPGDPPSHSASPGR